MMEDIFRLLPDSTAYHLSLETRDSIIQGKTYYPATNTEDEILAYNYAYSAKVADYMLISMSFETEQQATGMIEIRCFKKLNGDYLVVVSETGGIWQVSYHQHRLSAFVYTKNKKLIAYSKKLFPILDETAFMKHGTPDSIKNLVVKNSNLSFDLSQKNVILGLTSGYLSNNQSVRPWLKGDSIYFKWINDRFVMSTIGF
jgi:hypothetical protein